MKEMFIPTPNEVISSQKSQQEKETQPQKTLIFNPKIFEQKAAHKLADKDGYSLLLLCVNFGISNQKRPYIIAVTNDKADILLKKTSIQVTDFEQNTIIDLFLEPNEVNEKAINQAKEQFSNHFISNEKMKSINYKF